MDSGAIFDFLSRFVLVITIIGYVYAVVRYLNTHRATIRMVGIIAICVGIGGASVAIGIQSGTVSSNVSSRPLPYLGPIMLGAVTLSVLLGILNVFVAQREDAKQRPALRHTIVIELRMLLMEVLSILAIWLAYGTEVGHLPFGPPAPGVALGGLSLLDSYRVLAVVAHGLFAIAVPFLLFCWCVQLILPAKSARAATLFLTVGTILMMVGWEYAHWPVVFVMLAEGVMMYPVANGIFQVLTGGYVETTPRTATREQLKAGFHNLLRIAGITLVLFAHESPFGWLSILGVYWVLILLDPIAANVMAAIKKSYSSLLPHGNFFTPERSLVTVPLTLIVVALGASGLYTPISNNLNITYSEWWLGGAPALAYLITKPITDSARLRILEHRLAEGLAKMEHTRRQALDRALSHGEQTTYPASRPVQRQFHEVDTQQEAEFKAILERAIKDANRVTFPAAAVFLLSTWIYGNLITIPSLSALLMLNLTPVVLCLFVLLINASSGGLAEHLRSSAHASRMLSLIVVAITILTLILLNLPDAHASFSLTGKQPTELLQMSAFLLPLALRMVQEVLVLLVIGSLIYLLRILWASSARV